MKNLMFAATVAAVFAGGAYLSGLVVIHQTRALRQQGDAYACAMYFTGEPERQARCYTARGLEMPQ